MDLGPGKLVCHSHIGGNVFARSGRKREEMGSDKFGSLSGYVSNARPGGAKASVVSGLAAGQLSSTRPPQVSKAPMGLIGKLALAHPICKGRRVTNPEEVASQPLSKPPGGSGSCNLYRKKCCLARVEKGVHKSPWFILWHCCPLVTQWHSSPKTVPR